jgi:hypothetical protein
MRLIRLSGSERRNIHWLLWVSVPQEFCYLWKLFCRSDQLACWNSPLHEFKNHLYVFIQHKFLVQFEFHRRENDYHGRLASISKGRRRVGVADARRTKITIGDAQWPKSAIFSLEAQQYR